MKGPVVNATEPRRAASDRRLEHGSRSRAKILDAASRLMAARGYAATSIAHISEACGLPASSIYWHFESKEGLLAAVMERGAEQWFAGLPAWRETSGSPDERLDAALEVIVKELRDEPEFLRLYLLLALERRDIDPTSLGSIRRVREKATGRMRTMLGEVLSPPGEALPDGIAEALARFLLSFADGSFVAQHIDGDGANLERAFEDLAIALKSIARERMRRRAASAVRRTRRPRGSDEPRKDRS